MERDHKPAGTGRQRQHPPPASTTNMPGESPTLAGHSDREKPLFEQDRHIREWVGTSTAITERQRLEDELRASEQRFRITFLRQAKDGCEELILLVNNVLDALAVTEEMQPPPSEELFVAPLVCDVLDHLDPRKEQADRLSLEIPEQLTVWANGQLLRQVIRNLLSNAFKYCPKPASVIISAALSDPAAQGNDQAPQVLISVQDTGPGIPPTELPLLFQKFVRLERDLSGPMRGSGLGLYISKRFVEAMQGRIWVESAGIAGQGSHFCLTLPFIHLPIGGKSHLHELAVRADVSRPPPLYRPPTLPSTLTPTTTSYTQWTA